MALDFCGIVHVSCIAGLLCIFLMPADVSESRLSHMFIERKDLRNMESDLASIQTFGTASRPVLCSRVCLKHSGCMSYFENTRTKSCTLMSRVLSEDEMTPSEFRGLQYFYRTKSVCPLENGYVFDPASVVCFKLMKIKMTTHAAQTFCALEGGHLLRINSEEENTVVMNYLKSCNLKNKSPSIDGYRDNITDVWKFSDKTVLEYFNWASKEPQAGKHCIKLGYGTNFKWTVARCSRNNYFICEIPQK